VFLISGGRTYEMAPNTWGAARTDTQQAWTTDAAKCYAVGLDSDADQNCQTNNLYPGAAVAQEASSTASLPVGRGAVNTDAIIARMNDALVTPAANYAAGLARGYTNNGFTDWFLPSRDELNAMCNYSRNPTTPAAPTVLCAGVQNGTFAGDSFGFINSRYWSSSQGAAGDAWNQDFASGDPNVPVKASLHRVRPVRAF